MSGNPGLLLAYTAEPSMATRVLADCPAVIRQHLFWQGGDASADTWTISVNGVPVVLRVATWFALLGSDAMPRPHEIDRSKPVVPLGTPPPRRGC